MKKMLFALAVLIVIPSSAQTHSSTETSSSGGSDQSTEQQCANRADQSQIMEEDDPSFLESLLDAVEEELRSWEFHTSQTISVYKH